MKVLMNNKIQEFLIETAFHEVFSELNAVEVRNIDGVLECGSKCFDCVLRKEGLLNAVEGF